MDRRAGGHKGRKADRGQALVLFVGGLAALIGLAALGIDVGYMYTVRHELQRSADAGALAGASAFLGEDWNNPEVQAAATVRARDFATRDTVAGKPLSPGAETAVGFPSYDRVSVNTTRTVNLFFSRLILGPVMNIQATAVAEASVVDRNVRFLKPWAIPYPWEDTNGNGLYDPGETVHKDCPEGVVDTSSYFCPGTRVILKIGTPRNSPQNPSGLPSLQQEPGHFFALDFNTSGAAGYREAIETDSPFTASVGDDVSLETGDMVGPTRQGVKALVDGDPNSSWIDGQNLPQSDLYHIEDGSWMNSPRVVRIPVYDPQEALANGKTTMTVAGFAGFWIEDVGVMGTIIGRFIPNKAMGQSSGAAAGPSAGPVLKVLRLVQ